MGLLTDARRLGTSWIDVLSLNITVHHSLSFQEAHVLQNIVHIWRCLFVHPDENFAIRVYKLMFVIQRFNVHLLIIPWSSDFAIIAIAFIDGNSLTNL